MAELTQGNEGRFSLTPRQWTIVGAYYAANEWDEASRRNFAACMNALVEAHSNNEAAVVREHPVE